MNHAPGTSVGPALLIALLAHFALPSAIAWAQEVQASVLIETAGQTPVSMDYWATERGVRIDIAQPQQMSIVWISGPPPKMLVVQHANRRYIEINEQMFQMMRDLREQNVLERLFQNLSQERALTDEISARLEYRYTDLGSDGGEFDQHQALVGISYNF